MLSSRGEWQETSHGNLSILLSTWLLCGVFPKNGGTQQPWVFLLKMIILGCEMGVPPFKECSMWDAFPPYQPKSQISQSWGRPNLARAWIGICIKMLATKKYRKNCIQKKKHSSSNLNSWVYFLIPVLSCFSSVAYPINLVNSQMQAPCLRAHPNPYESVTLVRFWASKSTRKFLHLTRMFQQPAKNSAEKKTWRRKACRLFFLSFFSLWTPNILRFLMCLYRCCRFPIVFATGFLVVCSPLADTSSCLSTWHL